MAADQSPVMKHTCILFLSLAIAACHTTTDHSGDYWSTPEAQSRPAARPQPGQPEVDNSKVAAETSSTKNAATDAAAMKETSSRGLSDNDRRFATEASQGGMFEVKSSQLAIDKGVTGPTRDFAQMMIDDHGKANRDLESLVHKKGGTISNALDAQHQELLDELSALSGKEFERKYHDDQVKGHDDAIALFERYSKNADDPDVKAFANRLLPTLRAHRKHLDEHPME
jgi:putative membrane protein